MAPAAPDGERGRAVILVLASSSPFRRALLTAAGVSFAVHTPDVDEAVIKRAHADVVAAATALALAKAQTSQADIVIGADQILICEGHWFDKPVDLAEARNHLRALRGRRHELITACVVLRNGEIAWQHVATPALTMRAFSDAFLDDYLVAEGEVLCSTVGAYRFEGRGIQLFERVEGEHGAILGLPMLALLQTLRELRVLAD